MHSMYTINISSFAQRKVKKFRGELKEDFENVLDKLQVDPFQSNLKTHKLGGGMGDRYSCRLNYKDRVIFLLFIDKNILITDVGSHDEVY